jgi:hypothetical protein
VPVKRLEIQVEIGKPIIYLVLLLYTFVIRSRTTLILFH